MTPETESTGARRVRATHGLRRTQPDPQFELDLSEHLRRAHDAAGLSAMLPRFADGGGPIDVLMRRCLWRALARSFGNGIHIGVGVGCKHIETFEIGDGVHIADHAYIQGRFDGRCVLGAHSWIGPQAYLDARDLVLGEYVGWGPGAKVLGSTHTGLPVDLPIIQTDLDIRPVRVDDWADIGTNAVLLPGVSVGKASIVGAGAVVAEDVPPYAIVAGVPARVLRLRTEEQG